MKKLVTTALGIAISAGAATAGGIDRSGQSISAIYEKGTYAELSFGYISPSVSGNDVALFGGNASGNTAADYTQLGAAYKQDLSDKLSFAIVIDQPFGADISYPVGKSIALGGTYAKVDATAVTGVLRYKLSDRFSVHVGARADRASAVVGLGGAAYGAVSGYQVNLDDNTGYGYLIGAAYEIPDIALRVALTYNSSIEHDFKTVESGSLGPGTSTTKVKTPQSINLEFQSGVAADTLVFGSIRWVKWSEFKVDPAVLVGATGSGLVDIDNTTTYTLGVGRKLNDTWAGSALISYEKKGDPLVSPLAPTAGRFGVGLAAIYSKNNMKITTGVQYVWLGDAKPRTAGTARANFNDNNALAIGVKVGFNF